MRTTHWLALSLALIIAGIALAASKHWTLGYPLAPDASDDSWLVEARLQINPGSGPVQVHLQLPVSTPGVSQLRENFISRGYGLSVEEAPYQRTAVWAVRRASQRQSLYYSGVFYRDPLQQAFAPPPAYPSVPDLDEPYATAMQTIVDSVRAQSADIATFARELVERINTDSPGEEMALFVNSNRYRNQPVRIARTLLAGARIPSEQVNGFYLVDHDRLAEPVQWLAVHNGSEWLFINPKTGQRGLPDNFLVWWRGERPAVRAEGATPLSLTWSVRRNELGAMDLAEQRANAHDSWPVKLSLTTLPVQSQTVYAVLLLVPIGGLIMVVMRNLVGVHSFGTFMPVLIALAFRETGVISGLVLFSLVVGCGLLLRFYLEKLRLLLVPRLTAVLTIVVGLMVLLTLFSHRIGWDVGLSIGLFPMVILAMVIERMSIVWEERGPQDALVEAAGTAAIAVLAHQVMTLATVQHLVFVFPELLLTVLGATILLGRYSGYRLSELVRFRTLARDL